MHSDDSKHTHYVGGKKIGKSGEDEGNGIPRNQRMRKESDGGGGIQHMRVH